MLHKQCLGVLILLGCCLLEVSLKPTDEQGTYEDHPRINKKILNGDEILSQNGHGKQTEMEDENTKHILEKIKLVNTNINKKNKININGKDDLQKITTDSELNEGLLKKISQLILSGKLQPFSIHKKQDDNYLFDEYKSYDKDYSSRSLQVADIPQNMIVNNQPATPFLTSLPVLVIPSQNYAYGGYPTNLNMDPVDTKATRFNPSMLRGQIQWPFAQFFPILIKDPFLGIMNGGGLQNFVEYGQQADVCNRKYKTLTPERSGTEIEEDKINQHHIKNNDSNSRSKRDVTKQTSSDLSSHLLEKAKTSKKIYSITPITSPKPTKQTSPSKVIQHTKTNNPDDGDLRFPFGDFTWFGNRKPVAPSPGFFINKLRVRKGGVAIAGPGGVATAGRGGTAIVGPGGLAYTKPGGLAVAGPDARVVALDTNADLDSVVTRLQEQSSADRSVRKLLEAIPEGKVVATGPVVYYHPNEEA